MRFYIIPTILGILCLILSYFAFVKQGIDMVFIFMLIIGLVELCGGLGLMGDLNKKEPSYKQKVLNRIKYNLENRE